MSEDIPADVRERFDRAVSFVVVCDLLRSQGDDEGPPTIIELLKKNQETVVELMEEYPSLEPTTEGQNPAMTVWEALEETGVLEDNPALREGLTQVGDYLDERDEPVTLELRQEDI